MIYDEKFIETLPADNILAVMKIASTFIAFDNSIMVSDRIKHYSEYIDAFAAIEAFIKSRDLEDIMVELTDSKINNIDSIRNQFYILRNKYEKLLDANELESARNKYNGLFQNVFIYKFTDGDLKRIQTLINELRESIIDSQMFTANHKERLLSRLEILQKELHKKVSSLDKFWGLVGDAGVAIGKFGNDAKPFVDRIKEIAEIVWRTQANAEELPSGTKIPLLKSNEND